MICPFVALLNIRTYERDDGLSHSWIDHIICSQSFSSLVTNVYTTRSGCILSDHFPLCFLLHLNCSSSPGLSSLSSSSSVRIDWSKATSFDIDNFWVWMAECLLAFPMQAVPTLFVYQVSWWLCGFAFHCIFPKGCWLEWDCWWLEWDCW